MVFVLFGCAHARPHPSLPEATDVDRFNWEQAIKTGDHEALAQYYQRMAQLEREKAKVHDKAGTYYRISPHYHRIRRKMTEHCHLLKWESLKRAKIFEDLAREEEKNASGDH